VSGTAERPSPGTGGRLLPRGRGSFAVLLAERKGEDYRGEVEAGGKGDAVYHLVAGERRGFFGQKTGGGGLFALGLGARRKGREEVPSEPSRGKGRNWSPGHVGERGKKNKE